MDISVQDIYNGISLAMIAASAVTATTKTKKDDDVMGKIYKGIEILALVVGKAKDK